MEDSQRLEALTNEIKNFITEYQQYYLQDRNAICKPKVEQYTRQLDDLSEAINESKKNQRAKLFYLKGRLYDLLPEYQKNSEELLNKSVKLNPMDADCWNTLGHVLWKKKDYQGAKKAFQMAIENGGKNKVSLRNQSLLLRTQAKQQLRRKNVEDSVNLAKEALKLDLKDGTSWYFVGNAYLTNFFVNMKKISELQNAIKAYNEAQKYLKHKNPDLYVNRGTALRYIEDYQSALANFTLAQNLDPSPYSEKQIAQINQKFQNLQSAFIHFKLMKPKKIANLTKSIPTDTTSSQSLKQGINKARLGLKYISIISEKGDSTPTFLTIDTHQNLILLSVYNSAVTILDDFKQNSEIAVLEPFLKLITFKGMVYKCVQVYEINKLQINGLKMTDKFIPNTLVTQAFEK